MATRPPRPRSTPPGASGASGASGGKDRRAGRGTPFTGLWSADEPPSPGVPFGLLLLGAVLGAGALAAAAVRLALDAHADLWQGLGVTGLRCLLIPTRADLGAHVLSYLFAAVLLASGGWAATAMAEQLRRTRRLHEAVAGDRTGRVPRALRRALRRLGLAARTDVVVSDEPFAFCYGLLRPRICTSTGLARELGAPGLEAVLRHERFHLAQRDPLKLALGRALAGALFFLPAVGELLRRYELVTELAADRTVVAEMGGARPLAGALYRLAVRSGGGGPWVDGPLLTGAPLSGVAPWPSWPVWGAVPDHRRATATLDARIAHLLDDSPALPPSVSRGGAARSLLALGVAGSPLLAPGQSRAAAALLAEAHLVPGLC